MADDPNPTPQNPPVRPERQQVDINVNVLHSDARTRDDQQPKTSVPPVIERVVVNEQPRRADYRSASNDGSDNGLVVAAWVVGLFLLAAVAVWAFVTYYGPGSQQFAGGDTGYARSQASVPRGTNFMRAQQQAMCNEQVAKRRALGIQSYVVWDGPYTCRATGGMVENGRI